MVSRPFMIASMSIMVGVGVVDGEKVFPETKKTVFFLLLA